MTGLPEGVRIRRATSEDAEELAHLHLDVWDDAYTGLMPQQILDDRRERVAERVERWQAIVTQDEPPWIAIDADGPIGFASAGPGRDNDVDIDLELWSLYVRRRWWGTGVGYALFEAAVGDRAAYLWVLASNERAIRFYERQGFRLDGALDEHDEGLHARMVRAARDQAPAWPAGGSPAKRVVRRSGGARSTSASPRRARPTA